MDGDTIRLSFLGKGGKRVTTSVHDGRVAKVLQRCTSLPGEELFQYVDDEGEIHSVGSDDVNAYLRKAAGDDFSAKDFRTWAGTVIAAQRLHELGPTDVPAEAKRRLQTAISAAATQLGNTPAICRRCYVHPDIPAAYGDGTLAKVRFGNGSTSHAAHIALRPEERATLRLLKGARTRSSPRKQVA